jgi:D-xylose 1-dehydrogenase (NADP+, D-xylono-1,5-lactone-forming)
VTAVDDVTGARATREKEQPVSRPVRWGVLSTALINDKVLAGARLSDRLEVLGVASRDGARAQQYAARNGIRRHYQGYQALLADPEIEAVYISLPNSLHHEWTVAALRAGKHVLCEKPYSRRPAEVTEAFELARSSGLQLSEAFMYRYNPQTRRLVELVRSGELGELQLVVASFSWPTPATGDIRTDPGLEGGSLMDVGCYCVSVARLLAGEPESVTAQLVRGPHGVDSRLVGTLAFAGGVLAHLDSAFHLPDRSHLEVVGTRAAIRVSDPWHCLAPGLTLTGLDCEPRQVPVDPANSYQLELEQLGAAIRGEPNQLLGLDDALGQARTIEALYRAADGDGPVRPDEQS